MKVMTVLGTRPEIIRLSLVMRRLDAYCDHTLVHTGQNFTDSLSGRFLRDLEVRDPDIHLGIRGSHFGAQIGQLFEKMEPLFREHRPDRLLVLGDTNSCLAAVIARRMGIPVYHMEAGNRCFDDRVPEEVNRRIIDHCSSILMPYTEQSRENLLREGISSQRIYVTGNPIKEVMDTFADKIDASNILHELDLQPQKYFLVTMHRAENVDDEDRLRQLVGALAQLHTTYGHPVICSFHPRTRAKVEQHAVDIGKPGLRFLEPFGFFDFVRLEREAFCILSDSGTVQEEACIMRVPNVTIRDVTERPETIDCGSNVLSGADADTMTRLVKMVTSGDLSWTPPAEYMADHVSWTVARIVLGYRMPDAAEARWQNQG